MKLSPEQHTKASETSGYVFDIKRFAVHDGRGIRTTVFFKGCPLRCRWCQNPEGLKRQRQVLYLASKCIKCQSCVSAASSGAVRYVDGKIRLDRQIDENWDKIVDACPTRALQYDSRLYTVAELMAEIVKDKAFFKYDGGVTLSGGEPLLQSDFALEVLKQCRAQNIHTAIETSLYVRRDILEKIIPYLDQIYCDLKIFDDDKHLACTGVHNDIIKENIRFLLESGKKEAVTVRTPLIPQFTATKKNIGDISIFISKCYNDVKYEILNYNPLAKAKYSYLDMQYCFESNPKLYTAEQMQEFYSAAESSGIKNLIIE